MKKTFIIIAFLAGFLFGYFIFTNVQQVAKPIGLKDYYSEGWLEEITINFFGELVTLNEYEARIKMDNGKIKTFNFADNVKLDQKLEIGERVRVWADFDFQKEKFFIDEIISGS